MLELRGAKALTSLTISPQQYSRPFVVEITSPLVNKCCLLKLNVFIRYLHRSPIWCPKPDSLLTLIFATQSETLLQCWATIMLYQINETQSLPIATMNEKVYFLLRSAPS